MKKLFILAIVICMLFSISACGQGDSKQAEKSATPSSQAAANSEVKKDVSNQLYIEIAAYGNLTYYQNHKKGLKLAGEMLGVKTEYMGPADFNMDAVINAFEQAIAKKPNGIMVVGHEASLNALVDKAMAQGIPVVTLGADLPKSKRITFIGTGNFKMGYQAGQKLAQILDGKGKVVLCAKVGQSNLEERIQGYKSALSEYPGIEIVQVIDTQSDAVKATTALSAALQRFPDLSGIGAAEEAGGIGAATVVKESGKVGKIKITATDRSNEILQNIKDGVISVSLAQQEILMPIYGTQLLYNLNNYNAPVTSDNKAANVKAVPIYIETGTVEVNKDNCTYFMQK